MSKLEKMKILDIIEITNLYLTEETLFEIWKDDDEILDIPENLSGHKQLLKDPNLAKELMSNTFMLAKFLDDHDREIDKFRFVMTLLINYKERLNMYRGMKIDSEEMDTIQTGITGIKRLLKGIDRTAVFYNMNDAGDRITHLTIINSKEELEGKNRKERNSNSKRLQELKKDIDFVDITQSIFIDDIEYIIAFDTTIGSDIRYMIEHNTIMREYKGRLDELDGTIPVYKIAAEMDKFKFVEEMADDLEKHIEEINMDKLLLCSAYRFIEGLEEGWIKRDAAEDVKRRLLIIKKHIEKNPKIIIYPDISYAIRDLERDLTRFIGKENNVTYLSKEDIGQLREALLAGEITLNSLGRQKVEAMVLDRDTLSEVLQNNPNNYVFFLREEKCPYSKTTILSDIINSKKCSTDLLRLLCERTDITSQEVCDLFDKEIISVSDLKAVREAFGTVITDEGLFEKYEQYKANSEQEEARTQLERYALAYRNTEILGKTPEEIQSKAEEFIIGIGE